MVALKLLRMWHASLQQPDECFSKEIDWAFRFCWNTAVEQDKPSLRTMFLEKAYEASQLARDPSDQFALLVVQK